MAISIKCACGKKLVAPESAAGRHGKCPTCGQMVLIPSKPDEAEPPVKTVDESGGEFDGDSSQRRALIADADPSYLESTSQMFEDHGYEIVWKGSDAAELIDKVRELNPDIVVVDENLKGMKGFHVVKTLKDPVNPKNENIWRKLFVMTTDKMRGRDKQYALSLGIELFIEKPFTPARVFPRIERRFKKHTPA